MNGDLRSAREGGQHEGVLSLVIPAHDEAAALPSLFARLAPVLSRLEGQETLGEVEVILVDDGSRDDTWAVMQALAARDPRLSIVRLLRRFGQQAALLCGLARSRGDAVVILDADLQDPPEVIETMVARWQAGQPVVHGVRRSRRPDTCFKRNSARLFRRGVSLLAGTGLEHDVGDFVVLDREVVDLLLKVGGPRAFLRGEIAWAGFEHCAVTYDRAPRIAGDTKYSLRRMIALAVDGITALTFLPLRLVGAGGLLLLLLSAGLACVGGFGEMAWITVLAGLNLLGLGVVGEYVGRLFERGQGRPTYLVAEVGGLAAEANRSLDAEAAGAVSGSKR